MSWRLDEKRGWREKGGGEHGSIGRDKHCGGKEGNQKHMLTGFSTKHTELPKWTRVSQRINPPGF